MTKPITMSGESFRLHFADLVKNIKDDDEVYFGGGDLTFYRIKDRGPIAGPRMIQIEFGETYDVHPEAP